MTPHRFTCAGWTAADGSRLQHSDFPNDGGRVHVAHPNKGWSECRCECGAGFTDHNTKVLEERVSNLEAELAVRSGEWCAQNRADGCGACRWCCMQLESQIVDLKHELLMSEAIPVAKIRHFGPDCGTVDWMSYTLNELGRCLSLGDTLYAKRTI